MDGITSEAHTTAPVTSKSPRAVSPLELIHHYTLPILERSENRGHPLASTAVLRRIVDIAPWNLNHGPISTHSLGLCPPFAWPG